MGVQNMEANGHLKLQKQGQLTPINTKIVSYINPEKNVFIASLEIYLIYSIVDRIYIIRSYLYIKNHENIERNPNPLPAFNTTIL